MGRYHWVLLTLGSMLLIVAARSLINPQPAASAGDEPVAQSAAGKASTRVERIETRHVHNAIWVGDKVISGNLPEGDEGFAELQSLGVKTIISVDGATPDVAMAKKYGMRYVHLPFSYDGIPSQRVKELAKAVRELEGTIYIHCHHGRHRSPAASSAACVAAGLLDEASALSVLETAGTSPHYRGLYQAAEQAAPLDAQLLAEMKVELPETAELPEMAEAMVALEHTFDHVKTVQAAGWITPADHPDLVPAHEALLLREHFTEMLRADYVQQEPEGFKQLLRDSERAAQQLEDALRAWNHAASPAPPEAISTAAALVEKNCKACHEQFRDVPLSEKARR